MPAILAALCVVTGCQDAIEIGIRNSCADDIEVWVGEWGTSEPVRGYHTVAAESADRVALLGGTNLEPPFEALVVKLGRVGGPYESIRVPFDDVEAASEGGYDYEYEVIGGSCPS